jgi:hypothetical protein
MSLGTWPLSTPAERDALAFLIQHLPCDGRLEVEIRKAACQPDMPTADLLAEPECTSS